MYLVNYQAFNNTQIKNKDAVTIPPLNHIGPHLCLVDILLYYITEHGNTYKYMHTYVLHKKIRSRHSKVTSDVSGEIKMCERSSVSIYAICMYTVFRKYI